MLSFSSICLATQSGCGVLDTVDGYVTTHNLYGNLCEEIQIESEDGNDLTIEASTGPDDNLKEGSIQNEKIEVENQEEAL